MLRPVIFVIAFAASAFCSCSRAPSPNSAHSETRAAVPPPKAAASDEVLTGADKMSIAQVLCERNTALRSRTGLQCSQCPSYTELNTEAEAFELTGFITGDFSGSVQHEALVTTHGCETGAGSEQTYGGRALVRKVGGSWIRIYYDAGAPGDCEPFIVKAATRVVCHRRSGHMGLGFDTFHAISFEETEGHTVEHDDAFFQLASHSIDPSLENQKVPLVELKSWNLETADPTGVVINIYSTIDCMGGPSGCPGTSMSPLNTTLRYVFNGNAFQLAPESREAFSEFGPRNHE